MRITGVLVALCLCLVYVAAVPKAAQRIIGGSEASIAQYPSLVSLLNAYNLGSYYYHACGGVILNTRSILTAANCLHEDPVSAWRVRVGSSYANTGGTVHDVQSVTSHPDFDSWTYENDVAIVRTATNIVYENEAVQPCTIAGPNYIPPDDAPVLTAGWGMSSLGGPFSEELRDVEIRTINQNACLTRYTALGWPVTEKMICAGYPDGGRGQCEGDYGGPLLHNGVVVGIYSWGYQCALPEYPSINTRVSTFSEWIQENA